MPLEHILGWDLMIKPCAHVTIAVPVAYVDVEITNLCPYCGPVRVKWPE